MASAILERGASAAIIAGAASGCAVVLWMTSVGAAADAGAD
jgi:hypothetical protein